MRLISKTSALERLGCSLSTINRLIAGGRIKSVKIGRAVRIPESELDNFVSELMEVRHGK